MKVVAITIGSCAIIAGLVVYHLQTVHQSYLQGYVKGGSAVKAILSK